MLASDACVCMEETRILLFDADDAYVYIYMQNATAAVLMMKLRSSKCLPVTPVCVPRFDAIMMLTYT